MNGIYEEARIALHAIWRRRWLALGVGWALAILGWAGISLVPSRYESRARVFVQMQSLLPSKIGITDADRQRDVDRVRQTLTSVVNLEKVVRGTDLSLQGTSTSDVAGQVAKLQKTITVKATPDNIFEISAQTSSGGFSDAQNAKLAQAIVAKLIDIFVSDNLAGDRDETSQSLRFLDAQLAQRAAQLQDAETKRVAFEQKYMGMLPGVGSIDQRMEAARAELGQVDSQLVEAQSSAAAIQGQMGGTPATVSAPDLGGGGGGARGRIASLEGQLSDAAAKGWTDQHPDVIAIRSQIARLRSSARAEPAGAGTAPNPLYVSLRTMAAEKQAAAAALGSRKAQLQSDMDQFAAKQAAEPEVAAEQARLSRDYQVMKDQYDKLLADREDVKLRSDVASSTDSIKFRVIDPPSRPRVPVSPNRPLLLTLVLFAAAVGGAGAAFAKARLQTTFATPRQLEEASGLPVIGAISEVVTSAQAALRRQQLRTFGYGSGGLAGAWALLLLVEFVRRGLIA